jgi:hypothetical protein
MWWPDEVEKSSQLCSIGTYMHFNSLTTKFDPKFKAEQENLKLLSLLYFAWLRIGRTGFRFLTGVGIRDVSVWHYVHADSGAHPACYVVCTGGLFPEVQATEA